MQLPVRTTLVLLPGILALSLAPGGDPPPVLPAADLDACSAITPRTVDAWAATIGRALRSATSDARANGQNGAYAVAARNSRDLLDRAKQRVDDGAAKLRASDPRVTTYSEGGTIKEHVRTSMDLLTQAGHWALVSAAYHKSTDARDAFEGTMTALGEGQRLYLESGRCFLSNYFPE